jgi:phenylacetate-CoA ligase
MHTQPLHSVLEVVDEQGHPIEEGQEGIIVGTGLDNWAMPLIRYKVGDVAIPISKQCSCGRGYPLVERIVGRIEDYVVTPEGRYIGRLDHVFKHDLHVVEAQLIQEELDLLLVRVVKDIGYSDKDTSEILHELRNRLGNSMRLEFEFVPRIPREPNGKFRFVVSRVDKMPKG